MLARRRLGRNGIETLSKLSKEILIDVEDLQQMERFNFYAKSGDAVPFRFHTTAKLKDAAFQLTRVENKKLDNEMRMTKIHMTDRLL